MRRELLKLSLCALAAAWVLPRNATAQPPPSLVFAVITTTTVDETRAAWEPFFADMRKATGLDVQGYYAPSYYGGASGGAFGGSPNGGNYWYWLSQQGELFGRRLRRFTNALCVKLKPRTLAHLLQARRGERFLPQTIP